MTPAERAYERLHAWPDLRAEQPSCGTGRALRSAHGEIAHFHSARDVDLRLTDRTLRRRAADLRGSSAIRVVPGSRWVTVHLDCDTDVDLLLSLMSLALKDQSGEEPEPSAQCNFRRVTVVPRDIPA